VLFAFFFLPLLFSCSYFSIQHAPITGASALPPVEAGLWDFQVVAQPMLPFLIPCWPSITFCTPFPLPFSLAKVSAFFDLGQGLILFFPRSWRGQGSVPPGHPPSDPSNKILPPQSPVPFLTHAKQLRPPFQWSFFRPVKLDPSDSSPPTPPVIF